MPHWCSLSLFFYIILFILINNSTFCHRWQNGSHRCCDSSHASFSFGAFLATVQSSAAILVVKSSNPSFSSFFFCSPSCRAPSSALPTDLPKSNKALLTVQSTRSFIQNPPRCPPHLPSCLRISRHRWGVSCTRYRVK